MVAVTKTDFYSDLATLHLVDDSSLDKGQLPKLSLDAATKAWYRTLGGTLRPIDERGHNKDFEAVVRVGISRIKSPADREVCIQAMRECSFEHLVDRWFLLDMLHKFKAANIPLFMSKAEAMASEQQAQSLRQQMRVVSRRSLWEELENVAQY